MAGVFLTQIPIFFNNFNDLLIKAGGSIPNHLTVLQYQQKGSKRFESKHIHCPQLVSGCGQNHHICCRGNNEVILRNALPRVIDLKNVPTNNIKQACQTGGPIACLMRPAVTFLSHTITLETVNNE
jgi:hypothetical protein